MPHFDEQGRDTWGCQKCGRVYSATKATKPTWIKTGTPLAKQLGASGNICKECLERLDHFPDGLTHGQDRCVSGEPCSTRQDCHCCNCKAYRAGMSSEQPTGLVEHCRRESGLEGPALQNYINRYYGHG